MIPLEKTQSYNRTNKLLKAGLLGKYKSLPPTQEFKHKNTQRPQVCTHIVAFVQDDFGCHVTQCTTEGPGFLTHLNPLQASRANLEEADITTSVP